MKKMSSETRQALTRKDIEDIKLSIADVKADIKHGFEGTHQRQDRTNGQVQANKERISEVQAQFKYNRIIWYMFTVALGAIVFLIMNG